MMAFEKCQISQPCDLVLLNLHSVFCDLQVDHDSALTPEMPKRRDIVAIVLIVLPWTLLITVWHQNTITPLLAIQKGKLTVIEE